MLEFANDGGPLLIAPRLPASGWEGGEIPSGGRVVAAVSRTVQSLATDYDRACDVSEGAALLDSGTGWVIVLNSEVAGAAWIPLGDGARAAVIATSGGSDASLPDLYAHLAEGSWTMLASAIEIGAGGVFLMHAAGIPGTETEYLFNAEKMSKYAFIGDAVVYPFAPGNYGVEFLDHLERRTATTPGNHSVLVRFTRRAGSVLAAG